ncbi:MAG: SET domain-containing protein [Candidatus Saccharimonas sp.]
MQIFPPNDIYIASSTIPHAGRGVFTTRGLAAGETIEIAPIIRLERDDPAIASPDSMVPHYVFTFAEGYEGFALGYGSLYNHSYDPNMLYSKDDQLQAVVFTARRDIKSGEELTVTYNNSDPSDTSTPMNFGVPPYTPGNAL